MVTDSTRSKRCRIYTNKNIDVSWLFTLCCGMSNHHHIQYAPAKGSCKLWLEAQEREDAALGHWYYLYTLKGGFDSFEVFPLFFSPENSPQTQTSKTFVTKKSKALKIRWSQWSLAWQNLRHGIHRSTIKAVTVIHTFCVFFCWEKEETSTTKRQGCEQLKDKEVYPSKNYFINFHVYIFFINYLPYVWPGLSAITQLFLRRWVPKSLTAEGKHWSCDQRSLGCSFSSHRLCQENPKIQDFKERILAYSIRMYQDVSGISIWHLRI